MRLYHGREAYGLGRTCVRHSSRSLGGQTQLMVSPAPNALDQVVATTVVVVLVAAGALAYIGLAPADTSPGSWKLGSGASSGAALICPSALFTVRFLSKSAMPSVALGVGTALGSWTFFAVSVYAKQRWLAIPQPESVDWSSAIDSSRSWTWHWASLLAFCVYAGIVSVLATVCALLWFSLLVAARSLALRLHFTSH